MQNYYNPGPQPIDPKTGRFVKREVRLCKVCFAPARPSRKTAGGFNSKPLCIYHYREWKRPKNQVTENRRRTKRVLWGFNLPGGEYTYCPYIHPNWPEHKELRKWKANRMRAAKRRRTYYKKRAFGWAEKGLIDISPQELYNLISSSSSTKSPRK